MVERAWSWIDLIPLRCSGNQATISLEALVLMTTLVDLMVGSIQLGLVSKRGGGIQFQPSISQIYWSVPTESNSSIESITRSPSLLQSTLQPTVSVEASTVASKPPCAVDRVFRFDSHDCIDLQPTLRLICSLYYITVCYITLNLSSL